MSTTAARLTSLWSSSLAARALEYAPVLVAVALVMVFQVPLLHEPMEGDEGIYFTVASSGDLPYVSAFDHKPPLIFAWYRLALLLNGGVPSSALIHGMVTALLATTAVAVYATGRVMAGPRVGALAGLAFSLFIADQYLQFNGNTEAFALLPVSLSLLTFVVGWQRGGVAWFALAGAFGAVATLTRTTQALNLLALLAFLAWMGLERQRSWRWVAMASGAMAVAAGLVAGAAALPWIVTGHFDEFWFANVTFNTRYGESLGGLRLLGLAQVHGAMITGGLALWGLAAIGGVAGKLPGHMKLLLVLWLVGSFLGISSSGRQYEHYYIQLLPGAPLLAAFGLLWLASRWSDLRFRVRTYVAMVPMVAVTVAAIAPIYLASDLDAAHVQKYEGSAYGKHNAAADVVAERVIALTREGDTIYNLGNESQLYPLTGRPPAARVLRTGHLVIAPELRNEVLEQLRAAPPALIIDSSFTVGPAGDRMGVLAPEIRDAFAAFLAERYEFVETVEFADLYRLRVAPVSR